MPPATKTARKKFTGGRQGVGESVLDYVRRQLAERPPAENGTDPEVMERGCSPTRRSSRVYFRNSLNYPEGIEVGGSELFIVNPDGSFCKPTFRPDLSADQLDELQALANSRPHMTLQERSERRRLKEKRKREIDTYGRPVETASKEEQLVSALAQVGPELRKKLLKVALEDDSE